MKGTKLSLKQIAKAKPNPIFNTLPERLKDSSTYAPIETRVNKAMFSDHQHKTVKGMVGCKRCIAKLNRKQAILREEGFTSFSQYLEWKRVCSIIIGQQDIQLS